MKYLGTTSLVVLLIAFSATAFGQVSPLPPMVENDQFLKELLASLGGLSGASALAVAGIVTQLVAKFLNTNLMSNVWSKVSGIWKIVSILGLTMIGGVLAMMSQGVTLGAALIHSTVLSSLMVLANEIYKHVTESSAPKVS